MKKKKKEKIEGYSFTKNELKEVIRELINRNAKHNAIRRNTGWGWSDVPVLEIDEKLLDKYIDDLCEPLSPHIVSCLEVK